MIKIIEEMICEYDNENRHANIIISDGTDHYALGVGGLSLEGDLQPILEAEEASLWTVAVAKGNTRTTRQVRRLVYNAPSAGGWDRDDYQEAVFEKDAGDPTEWNMLKVRRAAIRSDWPL